MKSIASLFAIVGGAILAAPSFGQQVPSATKAAEVTAAATGVQMHPEYAKAIGRMAYIWGWPMVNQMNRRSRHHTGSAPGTA